MLDKIPPKVKRLLLIASVIGIIALLVTVTGGGKKIVLNRQAPVIEHVLTDSDTTEMGLEALMARMERQEESINTLKRTINQKGNRGGSIGTSRLGSGARVKEQVANQSTESAKMKRLITALTEEVDRLKNRPVSTAGAGFPVSPASTPVREGNGEGGDKSGVTRDGKTTYGKVDKVDTFQLKDDTTDSSPGGSTSNSNQNPTTSSSKKDENDLDSLYEKSASPFQAQASVGDPRNGGVAGNNRSQTPNGAVSTAPVTYSSAPGQAQAQAGAGTRNPVQSIGAIRVIEEEKSEDEEDDEEEIAEEDDEMKLPAGTMFSGILFAGMDAPTGEGARKDPFPAMMRIRGEAILPNRFKADFDECFLLLSGYGDISSERAYLRSESISCVREDGEVLESSIDAYAVGQDGSAGIRGRLVSKQGAIIARSLLAGFAEGVAEAFSAKPTVTIGSSGVGGETLTPLGTLQSGFNSGGSKALEKIADIYIKKAEGMYPIIEVDAGTQVDMILTHGLTLKKLH